MTIEAALFTTLSALVAGRVYPDAAPLGTVMPFICYEQAGGDALAFLDGTLPNKKHGRFEIGVYAKDRVACSSLALAVEATLTGAPAELFTARAIVAPMSDHNPETGVYSSVQPYSIFSDR